MCLLLIGCSEIKVQSCLEETLADVAGRCGFAPFRSRRKLYSAELS
jgi:hypothetical protein